jgi:Tfp pilus assembly protein PilN
MSAPSQLSFLPDDYLKRKAQRRANAICAVLFLVIMLAIGSAFTYSERSLKNVEKMHADVEQQYAVAAKKLEQVQEMQNKQRMMAQQAELAATLLEKVPRSFVLAELTNNLPAGVSLLDFTMESKKKTAPRVPEPTKISVIEKRKPAAAKSDTPAAPEVKVYDVFMKITGVAENDVQVAQYIARLNRSKLLKDVNLVISDQYEQDKVQMRKFTIEMMLDPNAEVQPQRETKVAAVELSDSTAK